MPICTAPHPREAGGGLVRFLPVLLGSLLLLGLFCVAFGLQKVIPGASSAARFENGGLFSLTNVWKIHLTFDREQWQAMEPKGGSGPFGGPGGPEAGPGAQLAPVFLKQGDQNHDQRLAREEYAALSLSWFALWDTNKSGELDANKIGLGIDAMMAAAGGGRPGGMGAQPGAGPGGAPGGGGPPLGGNRKNYTYVHGDMEFAGLRFEDVSVRYKGNNTYMTSRGMLKRPLKVTLNHGFKGRRLGDITTFNLHNNVNDPSFMNEPLSYQLFRDAGVPGSRTSYAQVFLTVPGQYTNQLIGLYSLIENIDNDFTRSRFGTKRGALFKPITRQLFEDLGDDWKAYEKVYDAKTAMFGHETQRVIEFSKLVSHATDAEFAQRLEEFLDLDEFARFMAVTVWLSNMDSLLSMGQNFYVYLHPKTHLFQFLPWDFDHSFGQFPMAGSASDLENLSILQPWSGRVRFLERVFQVEKFKHTYLARMNEFSKTIFVAERIQRQVDELAPLLRPALQQESAQLLARFDRAIAGEAVTGGFGGPPDQSRDRLSSNRRGQGASDESEGMVPMPMGGRGGPAFGPGGMGQGLKPIRTFVSARAKSVNDQLAGKSPGATLSRSGPGGPPGQGGPGGPPRIGRPGGRFGPGMFLAGTLMTTLDADKNGLLTREEFAEGMLTRFDSWSVNSNALTEEALRDGINRIFRGARPRGMDFGPPAGGGAPPDRPGGN